MVRWLVRWLVLRVKCFNKVLVTKWKLSSCKENNYTIRPRISNISVEYNNILDQSSLPKQWTRYLACSAFLKCVSCNSSVLILGLSEVPSSMCVSYNSSVLISGLSKVRSSMFVSCDSCVLITGLPELPSPYFLSYDSSIFISGLSEGLSSRCVSCHSSVLISSLSEVPFSMLLSSHSSVLISGLSEVSSSVCVSCVSYVLISNSRVCQNKYICKHQCHGIASFMSQQNVTWILIAFLIAKCVR